MVGFLARMDVTKQEDMSAFYRNMLDQTTDVVIKTEPAQNENTASPDEGYSICSSYVKSLIMTALHSRCGHYIFALWFLLSFFFFSSLNLSHRRLDVCHTSTRHTWCGLSANLRSRSETCCTGSLKIQDAKSRPKIAIWALSQTLSGYILATKALIENQKETC